MPVETASASFRKNSLFQKAGFKVIAWLRRLRLQNDGPGNANDGEVQLDDECAKVFAMDSDTRFDVEQLHDSPPGERKNFGENEYSLHRKTNYPHMHAPIKPPKSTKRRGSQQDAEEDVGGGQDTPSVQSPDSNTLTSGTTHTPTSVRSPVCKITDSDTGLLSSFTVAEEDDTALSSGSEYILSDPSSFRSPPDESPDRKVQFHNNNGTIPEDSQIDGNDDKKHRRSSSIYVIDCRHHHTHHSKLRKYSLPDDPNRGKTRRVSTQPEDLNLKGADRDQLESHRSDDPRALRRHKARASNAGLVHVGRKDGVETMQSIYFKKMYDHSPHAIFVQLDELDENQDDSKEWKETARWIKYEEDVEEGVDRWGKPHVASLSFHSLLNLRRCLEDGLVILDMEEKDLPGIAYRISEEMYKEDLITEGDKAKIMRILLLKHRHVNEHHERGFRFPKKHSYSSLQSLWLEDGAGYEAIMMARCSVCSAQGHLCGPHALPRSSIHSLHDIERKRSSLASDILNAVKNGGHFDQDGKLVGSDGHTIVDMKEETYTASTEDLKKVQNEDLLKKIPEGAQGSSILVGKVDFLEQPAMAFIRLAEGVKIPFLFEVNIPVRFIFILLGPPNVMLDYHEVGRSISTLMANQQFHNLAYTADNRKVLLSAINEFLDDSIVLPPGDWEHKALLPIEELKAKSEAIKRRKQSALIIKSKEVEAMQKPLLLAAAAGGGDDKKPPFGDPLERTRRPFGGLINDIRRRYPHFKSDFTDAFNSPCIAAAIFMYFAALSTAITFGGLVGDKTDNYMGISETLMSGAIGGVLFTLFSGQPLIITGATGPLLLFDESLLQFCKANDIEFLTVRVYIGIWLAIIALFVASLEGSVLVKAFTRFTQEIFSALISLIYIIESIQKLILVFHQHPLLTDYCGFDRFNGNCTTSPVDEVFNSTILNITEFGNETYCNDITITPPIGPPIVRDKNGLILNQPNTALMCVILALGTFVIAYYLRLFRNSQFLGRSARRALGDFGVPIAIIMMVLMDYSTPQVYTDKLLVPAGISPTKPDYRGWLINPAGTEKPFPLWLVAASCIPAMLVYILIFMETHISELIVDKKERKLKKGSGFHLDIVILCLINIGNGFFGAPWICAATVRSIAHVAALTIMSRTHAPGEKPHIIEVKEQRVSGLIVSVLMGLSVLMSPLLRLIPMSVLFGVFLYMGVASINGVQMFERIRLLFMPVKHHPSSAPYVKRVRTVKMHLFTFVQIFCLTVLWVVKSTKASLAFPFFLILLIPLRSQLNKIFTPVELRGLDGEQPDLDDDDEPDFYVEATLPG
nr:anion exchange protein 2 isoform X2 [Onthophagus taurus]